MSTQYAAEHLTDLLTALSSGEAVEVERPDGQTLRLTAVTVSASGNNMRKPRVLGGGRFDGDGSSLSYEEWERIDREWKASFADKFDEAD